MIKRGLEGNQKRQVEIVYAIVFSSSWKIESESDAIEKKKENSWFSLTLSFFHMCCNLIDTGHLAYFNWTSLCLVDLANLTHHIGII